MAVRSSMSSLIARVRLMIADPSGVSQQFSDQDVQDRLDANRDDIRYEPLKIAPSIVNTASTGNMPVTIFADFYSAYEWWESDVVLQAQYNGAAWAVVTAAASDYITGHWQFETNVFTSGTVPGQLPPVFATGKIYDIYASAADLLEYWAATLTGAYNISVDGQNLQRSQLMQMKLTMAQNYRSKAKLKIVKMRRSDVQSPISSKRMRLLDADDVAKES